MSDTERRIQASLPGGLFTEDPNSSWVILRTVFSDWLEARRTDLDVLYQEELIGTSSVYLYAWETQVGLSANPTNRTLTQRRAAIKSRFQKGPFTRTRRNKIIESFISATFGVPPGIPAGGLPIPAGGIPLYGDVADLQGTYIVTEVIPDFHYIVEVKNTLGVDIAALTRELEWVTTAGISFEINQVAIPAMYPDPDLYPNYDLYPEG